jgi:hypothetical protein
MTALLTTDYGRLLLVKIALFIAMLSLAAVNDFGSRLFFGRSSILRQCKPLPVAFES